MASFKLYDMDIGLKVEGVDYAFDNVAEVQFEDPERNRLTRGANATDEIGLEYKDGLKDPKRITVPIMQMSLAIVNMLRDAFKTRKRVDFYGVSRADGSSAWGKNCVVSNNPRQLTWDETAESLNVSIELETFKLEENHKS